MKHILLLIATLGALNTGAQNFSFKRTMVSGIGAYDKQAIILDTKTSCTFFTENTGSIFIKGFYASEFVVLSKILNGYVVRPKKRTISTGEKYGNGKISTIIIYDKAQAYFFEMDNYMDSFYIYENK